MKQSKEKVTLKYSKKEQDFITKYPEYKNRNGRITGNFLLGLLELAEETVISRGNESLRDYFDKGGFDIETFKISINAKQGQTNNERVDGRKFT